MQLELQGSHASIPTWLQLKSCQCMVSSFCQCDGEFKQRSKMALKWVRIISLKPHCKTNQTVILREMKTFKRNACPPRLSCQNFETMYSKKLKFPFDFSCQEKEILKSDANWGSKLSPQKRLHKVLTYQTMCERYWNKRKPWWFSKEQSHTWTWIIWLCILFNFYWNSNLSSEYQQGTVGSRDLLVSHLVVATFNTSIIFAFQMIFPFS